MAEDVIGGWGSASLGVRLMTALQVLQVPLAMFVQGSLWAPLFSGSLDFFLPYSEL